MLKQVSSDDWYIVLWLLSGWVVIGQSKYNSLVYDTRPIIALSDTNEDSNDDDHGSDDIIEDSKKDSSNSFNYCGHDFSVVTYA